MNAFVWHIILYDTVYTYLRRYKRYTGTQYSPSTVPGRYQYSTRYIPKVPLLFVFVSTKIPSVYLGNIFGYIQTYSMILYDMIRSGSYRRHRLRARAPGTFCASRHRPGSTLTVPFFRTPSTPPHRMLLSTSPSKYTSESCNPVSKPHTCFVYYPVVAFPPQKGRWPQPPPPWAS